MITVNCNDLPGHLKGICDGSRRKATGKYFTIGERLLIVARHLRVSESSIRLPQPTYATTVGQFYSGIGDRLHEIILDKAGATPCGECKDDITKLNLLSIEEVKSQRESIADRIIKRAKTQALYWWQRWGATLAPEMAKLEVLKWIDEACSIPTVTYPVVKEIIMNWAYGVTTVPERKNDLLPHTLESLRMAGFDKPRLFVDGIKEAGDYARIGLEVTTRHPQIRTFANWCLALGELYLREPTADRYAIFQDDFVTYRNLRQYLEKVPYPDKGYINLYTMPRNQALCPVNHTGFYLSNQLGKGAVGLVFSNEAVLTLLGQYHMLQKPKDSKRGWKSLDGAIVTAMKLAGWKEYVHSPSLLQHTGITSSMKNRQQPLAESFKGEDFDALELLKENSLNPS